MPSITIDYTTEAERLALEQAIAFFTQMRLVAATAPDGSVLAACEQVALDDGRRLLRDTLASAVQARADSVLGVGGYLTAAATRMAVLAGVRQSFAKAEQLLGEAVRLGAGRRHHPPGHPPGGQAGPARGGSPRRRATSSCPSTRAR